MSQNDDYLQMYLDDTDEQLATLSQLADDAPLDMREVRRLMHAMEGAAGALELDNVREVVQRFCRQIERGRVELGRCVAFLQVCNGRLKEGARLGTTDELLLEFENEGR